MSHSNSNNNGLSHWSENRYMTDVFFFYIKVDVCKEIRIIP